MVDDQFRYMSLPEFNNQEGMAKNVRNGYTRESYVL